MFKVSNSTNIIIRVESCYCVNEISKYGYNTHDIFVKYLYKYSKIRTNIRRLLYLI